MKGRMKRTLARILAVIMVVSMMPMTSFGAVSAEYKWQVGNTKYEYLKGAVEAVPEDGTITMLGDVQNGLNHIDVQNKSFTINLGGYTLTNTSGCIQWDNAKKITIKNGTVTATMEAVNVSSGCQMILEDVTITNASNNSSALGVTSGGQLQIITGTFSVSTDCKAPAISVEDGGTVTFGTCTDYPKDWAELKFFKAEKKEPRFSLGTTDYYDFTRAVSAASDNSTIKVLQDVTIEDGDVTSDANWQNGVTLNLNNKTLTTNGDFDIHSPLKVKDGTLNVDGQVNVSLTSNDKTVTFENIHLKTKADIICNERGKVILGAGDYETTSDTGGMDAKAPIIIAEGYATDAETESWGKIKSVHVGKDINLYFSEIESAVATGDPVETVVKAYDYDNNVDGKQLEEGVDFKIEYDNNILPGIAKAIIIGIGDYGGKIEKTFAVTPGAVPNIQTQYTCNSIFVSWNAVNNSTEEATKYVLKLVDKNNSNATVRTVETVDTAEAFSGLTVGTEYLIQISAGFMMSGSLRSGEIMSLNVTPNHTPVTDPAVAPTCTETGLTEGSHCKVCLMPIVEQTTIPAGHNWKSATCTTPKTCQTCGETEGATLAHKATVLPAKAATCTTTGLTAGEKCSVCGETTKPQQTVAATGHKPGAAATCTTPQKCTVCQTVLNAATGHKAGTAKVTVKATTSKDGKIETKCTACSKVLKTTVIKKASKVKLSTTSYTYNGKKKSPKIYVKDSAGKTISSKYYKVSNPSGRKSIGKYTYTVKFTGNYSGTKKLTLTIKPVKPTLNTPKAAKKAITVKWKKGKKAQVTGYQVMVATNSKFTKNKKTATVKGYTKVSKKMTGLKAKTKYYVKVRSYKTVKGVKIYSSWSKVKTIKTK